MMDPTWNSGVFSLPFFKCIIKHMGKELEALINKALYEDKESYKKEEEKKPVAELTDEDKELVYNDKDDDYEQPWQRVHNR